MATVWAVVLAAGTGTRFGSPKQYELLGDRRVLDWAVAAARTVAEGVVLVVAPDRAGEAEPGVDAVVAGAPTRSGSVRAGLAAVPGEADIVVVHDAARPLASPELFATVVTAVENGLDGAVPGVPVPDTVDVKAMRKRLGLTQAAVTQHYRFALSSMRHWEQGRRQPEGPARTLLVVIDREPEAVLRALCA